jgi:hypothetical protein
VIQIGEHNYKHVYLKVVDNIINLAFY